MARIIVIEDTWAAIDKKRNVITPDGVTEPEDKENTTPGGLHINKDGYFEILQLPEPEEAEKVEENEEIGENETPDAEEK